MTKGKPRTTEEIKSFVECFNGRGMMSICYTAKLMKCSRKKVRDMLKLAGKYPK